ncbi:oxaloacetate decarboxylase [Pseudorhodoferax sp. Leaf267]|uniref:isocitrate lyase/PEP mutase family protein n=1 Tax=Pseudorhodoferax sp. Leaf267 TaxID=1736316 RepID=UPI0006F875A4|nr:isocitrate lyase/PEP mutase family protein [Pseudorhodoferax sp. Leaf267]KQP18087.1 2,3-dimethylmalate lyase [Pseudorhodoferax sp. Leaf267]
MTHPAISLKRLLSAGTIVQAPGAYDGLSARLVERAGFAAVYMTGFGATATRLGQPDIGLLTQTEMTTHARDMVRAVGIPVIADADTGYGGPSNIERTVREYVQAGVAAIHLEDQVAPKRCGQMSGIRLIDAAENARRLRCAVQSRGEDALLLIGRTDALPAAGIDEAVSRAQRYQDAGVDLVFVDGIKTVAEVEAVARRVAGPKVVSIVDGTPAVALTAPELQALGFSIVFYAVTALFSAARAVQEALAALHAGGTPAALAQPGLSYAAFADTVGLPHHQQLDEQYGAST